MKPVHSAHDMDNKKTKPSALWYLLPVVFSILGAIIAYYVIQNRDKKMARRCLYLGFGLFFTKLIFVGSVVMLMPPSDNKIVEINGELVEIVMGETKTGEPECEENIDCYDMYYVENPGREILICLERQCYIIDKVQ